MDDRHSHESRHPPQRRSRTAAALLAVAAALLTAGAGAQDAADDEPPALDSLVGSIALYPDDLIGIVLPASTYPLQIVEAARFLEAHEDDPGLEPDADWDDSVVALLNYPDVLRMLDDDLDWTWALGEAVLDEPDAVLDAIQDFRDRAYAAGNLQSDDRQRVNRADEVIEIAPADPQIIYVPYYEPRKVVVHQPAPVIRYYPRSYPVYYYPYATGHSFTAGFFWGVTSVFSVSWHSHRVHVHHHSHHSHPYYRSRHRYDAPYYVRRGININVSVSIRDGAHVWHPSYRRAARPHRGRVVDNVEQRVRRGQTTRARGHETRTTATREARSRSGTARREATAARRTGTNERADAARANGRSDAARTDAVIRGLATRRAEARTGTRTPTAETRTRAAAARTRAADARAAEGTRQAGDRTRNRRPAGSSRTSGDADADTRSLGRIAPGGGSAGRASDGRSRTESRRPEPRSNAGQSRSSASQARSSASQARSNASQSRSNASQSRGNTRSLGGVRRSRGSAR